MSLRRAHRVHLSRYGAVALRARPIKAAQVCSHAEKFWFGSLAGVDARDIQLHAILVLGLNLGVRFEEIAKLTTQHISIDDGSVILTITVSIKNSTEQRNYHLREWPGNSALRHSVFMDPFVALYLLGPSKEDPHRGHFL